MPTISVFLILLSFCFATTHRQWALRRYRIEKDFFFGLKAGEFSFYDQSGRSLLYRLESRYAITQTAELLAYPNKQIIASIRKTLSPFCKNIPIEYNIVMLFFPISI
jgi:hypothetical protein